jgi:molybdate transport system substrate-binding protein
MRSRSRPYVVLVAVLAVAAAACGDDDDDGGGASPSATTAAASTAGTGGSGSGDGITVFAATSLTEAFTEVGNAFAATDSGAEVTFSFDASSGLVQQIIEGAPADVFASADTANMDKLTDEDLHGTEPVIFATNLLTIIVPAGNPAAITGVEDLANPDLNVVLCAEEVPCGNYANQILDAAGVEVTPVSLEENVRGVVTKVTAGEADAGIVYVTDVTAAGDAAEGVEIPADINVLAEYPIATVGASENQETAEAFIDYLTGPDGQAIMAEYGFGAAP